MAGTIEVLVAGGQVDPGPPLGPELGPTPVDVQAVVGEINDQTEAFDGTEVPVTVEYDDDGAFTIDVGVPPTAALIKDEAGFETGSGEPQENFVADLSMEQVKTIAEQKHPDLLSYELKQAAKEIIGTASRWVSRSKATTPARSPRRSTTASTTRSWLTPPKHSDAGHNREAIGARVFVAISRRIATLLRHSID